MISDQNISGPEEWKNEEGGLYGRWILDETGQPAYAYTYLDRASLPNKATGERPESFAACRLSPVACGLFEDHWHQIGNDRYTAEAHAGGWVVPYRWEHGLTRLSSNDHANPDRLSGLGTIRLGDHKSITLLPNLLPENSPWRVIFGEGYAQWVTEIDGLKIKKRVISPFGDDPILIVEIEIQVNSGDTILNSPRNKYGVPRINLEYEEAWNIEPYPITFLAPMTKHSKAPRSLRPAEKVAWHAITATSGALRRVAEAWRGSYSRLLDWKVETNEDATVAIARPTLKHFLPVPEPGKRSWRDLYPQPVFIAACDNCKVEVKVVPEGISFIARDKFDLKQGETHRLKFIFGWGEDKEIPLLVAKYRSPILQPWKDNVPVVSIPGEGWIEREMPWHGYYLRSMLVKDDYFECHLLPQASAYGYLHGMHGAPRDYALAAVPMIYLAPDRAKEMILQMMRLMLPSGEMIYAHGGFGKASGAIAGHAAPTDLPVFLLWTLMEYFGATGDIQMLDESVPFYPKEDGRSSTVRERIEIAWYYLKHRVGRGPHGLLRVGTGDWNDPISLMVPSRSAFVKNGESAFNTAFAIYVLPKIAEIVELWDKNIAREMRNFSESLSEAMNHAWTGEWYLRGYNGKGGEIGNDRLFLDSNVWCLIAGIGGKERMKTLVERIGTLLDDPSPVGATILDQPVKVKFGALVPGWDCNGGVWAALNGLLAWGYSLYNPDRAWRNLYKQSLAAHARAYPHIWFGIWSGPDAYNAHYAERPGETFIHPITPMQEYPIMNSNAHALPLLGLIKIAGFEPHGTQLKCVPKLPDRIGSWRISFPLVEASRMGEKLEVKYHKIKDEV